MPVHYVEQLLGPGARRPPLGGGVSAHRPGEDIDILVARTERQIATAERAEDNVLLTQIP